MLTEQEMLIAAINSQPEEDTLRLVYADWLDENDRCRQAEFIRIQIALTHPAPVKPKCSPLGVMLRVAIPFFGALSATNKLEQYKQDLNQWTQDRAAYNLLPKREKELWRTKNWTTKPEGLEHTQPDDIPETIDGCFVENWQQQNTHSIISFYERGCIFKIFCSMESFMAFGKAIFMLNPITSVSLTHKTPIDGKCWVNADAPKGRNRFSWLRSPPRHSREQIQEGSLPEAIFRCLPGVASYANWTTYKNTKDALNALNIACLTYGRAKPQPVETNL